MPKLGKRVPLTLEHFSEFVREFGDDSMGEAPRIDGGVDGRFRVFSRQQIADGADSLDLKWLVGPDEFDPEQVLVPDEILAAMVADLKVAVRDLEDLQAVLSSREGE